MPRPVVREITFTLDGREINAPEGMILVDAANAYGDTEIPVFCYEPKLGQPVGACRMCLVEIEGIPKLQTGCSTPIRDGMVVHTQTQRVHDAQRAVVEFLLINHPLDCPVCDKGGECPLQDITYGWGPGTSRFIEPKRHFKKPLELSPLIAIDRERCILCYRCVRYSQEVSEDYQLVLQQRGAASYVSTFDGHPYVAPFSGNIIELCPVGALTSRAYRFRARPWDIEGAGTVCAGCTAQCNVELTVRDERVLRVLARDNSEVDDGWLCDKGRFSYQAVHSDERITTPLVRDGEELLPASWEKAIAAAASALKKAGDRAAALAGGTTTNEEAFLLAGLLRDKLGSSHLATRPGEDLPLDVVRALADPKLQATVPDLEFAHTVLLVDCDPIDEAPVWDLRIRKGVRRHGTKLVVASARPTALDPERHGHAALRPGRRRGLPRRARRGAERRRRQPRRRGLRGGLERHRDPGVRRRAARRRRGSRDRLRRPRAERLRRARAAEHRVAPEPGRHRQRGPARAAVHAERPRPARGRLRGRPRRRVRVARRRPATAATAIASGLASGDLHTVWLHHVDVLRTFPNRPAWEQALGTAQTVIAVESQLTDTVREFADVVFPAEGYPEKEGTITHPDGRVQRLRQAIGHPRNAGGTPGSGVRAAVAGHLRGRARARLRRGHRVHGRPGVPARVRRGAVLQRPDARRHRRPRPALAGRRRRYDVPASEPTALDVPAALPADGRGELRLGTYRSLWAHKDVDLSPALQFIRAKQVVELSPSDAAARGINQGDRVEVGNGTRIPATANIRAAIPAGSVFVADGIAEHNANVLTHGIVDVHRVGPGSVDAVVDPDPVAARRRRPGRDAALRRSADPPA